MTTLFFFKLILHWLCTLLFHVSFCISDYFLKINYSIGQILTQILTLISLKGLPSSSAISIILMNAWANSFNYSLHTNIYQVHENISQMLSSPSCLYSNFTKGSNLTGKNKIIYLSVLLELLFNLWATVKIKTQTNHLENYSWYFSLCHQSLHTKYFSFNNFLLWFLNTIYLYMSLNVIIFIILSLGYSSSLHICQL